MVSFISYFIFNSTSYLTLVKHRQLFVRHVGDVLCFRDMGRAFKPAVASKYYVSASLRLIDGLFLNWISYFIHIVFPLYVATALVETVFNVVTRRCFNPIAVATDYVQDFVFGWINFK